MFVFEYSLWDLGSSEQGKISVRKWKGNNILNDAFYYVYYVYYVFFVIQFVIRLLRLLRFLCYTVK